MVGVVGSVAAGVVTGESEGAVGVDTGESEGAADVVVGGSEGVEADVEEGGSEEAAAVVAAVADPAVVAVLKSISISIFPGLLTSIPSFRACDTAMETKSDFI